MPAPAPAVPTLAALVCVFGLSSFAGVAAAEPSPTPRALVPADAEDCRDQPVLVGQASYPQPELFDRVTTLTQHAQMLACATPSGKSGVWPGEYWGETLILAYLARSEYAGGDPVMVAFALNTYARLMARKGSPYHEKRKNIAAVLAGYHRLMPADQMAGAVRQALPPALADVLIAGCAEAAEDARAQGPEDPLWVAYQAYATEAAPVHALLGELRVQALGGAKEQVLARLDAERLSLLAGAKDREAALRTASFRELSGLARAVSAASDSPRPFEQMLPEPLHPTWMLATTKDPQRRTPPLRSPALDGVEMAWRVVRAKEFGRGRPTPGSDFFVGQVKKVGRPVGDSTRIELDNKKTTSYAGQCRTTLVFIDTAGQGWGTERCSASADITVTTGPPSVNLTNAAATTVKKGHYIEYYSDEAGASGHLVRVWDSRFQKLLAIGPFAL